MDPISGGFLLFAAVVIVCVTIKLIIRRKTKKQAVREESEK